jgi:hypothetical protein
MAKATKKRTAKRAASVTTPYLHSSVATLIGEVLGQHVQMSPEAEAETSIHLANTLEQVYQFDIQRR